MVVAMVIAALIAGIATGEKEQCTEEEAQT
jgi:hypothetical protein